MTLADRPPFGWDTRARWLLIALATIGGSVLAWASSGPEVGEIDLPALSVDANSVPLPVLGALPGLGPVLSGRIVEAREIRLFRSMDDFDRRVYGIGPAKVAALRPFLRFEPPTP
jgi:DNA uptake protein ComE-like DNA-binding protein